ncbi:MAG: hypothetical protein IPI59_02265 [Sphingobacteriales bacterium]|jgi:hypothetical protein|nr:hypothetical protein [Sphingobacteriales bacterium]MBP9141401.1 hypothetical protein [Chitinophagales bacterium]MDA0197555.1 hypothetical protein [Bacteroidota bacterium]MBK7526389.1 hypothetical protein [Sphingobacteriales bacterium]MBK8680055.1 hypothetical protein [Sphingobacteriales bacterium]
MFNFKLFHLALPLFFLSYFLTGSINSSAQIVSTHPRLLFTTDIKNALLDKKNNNDPTWLALKTRADNLTNFNVLTWNQTTYSQEPSSTIAYSYQGSGWFDAAMNLGLAHQISKGNNTGNFPTDYSNKLLQLADTIIAAQNHYWIVGVADTIWPIRVDSHYPSRFICRAAAIIYDWAYDELGASRRTQLAAVMNQYFTAIRNNGYQNKERAGDNYFMGHTAGIGYMGYALFNDNANAQTMIDWARNRFDGTKTTTIGNDTAYTYISQLYNGGYPTVLSAETYNNPDTLVAKPLAGGWYTEGWAYGAALSRLLDYMQVVSTATTDQNLIQTYQNWLVQLLNGQIGGCMPNRSEIDFFADWGGDWGAFFPRYLATRLAFYLAGTTEGEYAQYFRHTFLQPTQNECITQYNPSGVPYPDAAWEAFYFHLPNATATPFEEVKPLCHSGFANGYYGGWHNNQAVPYFLMRNSWDTSATWASIRMGCATYEGHEHKQAGHIALKRNNEWLLMEASLFKQTTGEDCNGMVGSNVYMSNSAHSNTLFFYDNGDYMYDSDYYVGGQTSFGHDAIVAAEQNNKWTYVRGNLRPAYYKSYDTTLWNSPLQHFYRNYLYLNGSNLMVVFDQVKVASNSGNPYIKALRWHFTGQPTQNGNITTLQKNTSKLYLHTLLPQTASIDLIDESNNPDTLYYDDNNVNPQTWRIDVKHPVNNTLEHPFLTVITAGNTNLPAITTQNITTTDAKMTGAAITNGDQNQYVALFNSQSGLAPAPVTNTQYVWGSNELTQHTLCGVQPNANYQVDFAAGSVQVTQNAMGSCTASVAGVLQFHTVNKTIAGSINPCNNSMHDYTAPTYANATYNWVVTGGVVLSGQGSPNVQVQWGNSGAGSLTVQMVLP